MSPEPLPLPLALTALPSALRLLRKTTGTPDPLPDPLLDPLPDRENPLSGDPLEEPPALAPVPLADALAELVPVPLADPLAEPLAPVPLADPLAEPLAPVPLADPLAEPLALAPVPLPDPLCACGSPLVDTSPEGKPLAGTRPLPLELVGHCPCSKPNSVTARRTGRFTSICGTLMVSSTKTQAQTSTERDIVKYSLHTLSCPEQ